MCGIALTSGKAWTNSEFRKLFDAIAHRGPDASGVLAIGPLRIGMNRLHLRGAIDSVPVCNKSGIAAFNGQVYNICRPDGSIANIPHGLVHEVSAIREGIADGMFAAALSTVDGSEILLKTDDQFIKPLFYAHTHKGIAACSELAPLIVLVGHHKINWKALTELFAYGWYLDDHTWVEGVSILFRHNLIISGENSYIRHRSPINDHKNPLPNLRTAVRESLQRCIEGAGPFGLALSGGLDSTILAWELNAIGIENLQTFSVHLPENRDGVLTLKSLGLPSGGAWRSWRHHVIKFKDDADFMSAFQISSLRFSQPTTMSSLPLTWRMSERAAEAGVRVMLTGEGVDELFCGYGSYAKMGLLQQPLDYYRHHQREVLIDLLFGEIAIQSAWRSLEEHYRNVTDLRHVERELRLARLLLRNDVCFMAHSIEARVPFLHNRIPELALNLAWEELLQNGGKAAVRSAWRQELGAKADIPKTRFKASDQLIRRCLAVPNLAKRVYAALSNIFGIERTRQCLAVLQTESGFNADIACILISLCFLLESEDV